MRRRTSSPTRWPCCSLTCLNSLRSRRTSERSRPGTRAARSISRSRLSCSAAWLRQPVSPSVRASWAIAAWRLALRHAAAASSAKVCEQREVVRGDVMGARVADGEDAAELLAPLERDRERGLVALERRAGGQAGDARVVVREHRLAALEHLAREPDARLELDPDHLGRRAGGGGDVEALVGRAAVDDGEVGVEDRERLAADAGQQGLEVEGFVQRLGGAGQGGLALDLLRLLVGGAAAAERGAGGGAEPAGQLDVRRAEAAAAEQQRLAGQGDDQEVLPGGREVRRETGELAVGIVRAGAVPASSSAISVASEAPNSAFASSSRAARMSPVEAESSRATAWRAADAAESGDGGEVTRVSSACGGKALHCAPPPERWPSG